MSQVQIERWRSVRRRVPGSLTGVRQVAYRGVPWPSSSLRACRDLVRPIAMAYGIYGAAPVGQLCVAYWSFGPDPEPVVDFAARNALTRVADHANRCESRA